MTTVTIPFGCVDDDTLVIVLGGVGVKGGGVTGSAGLLMVVHDVPNNVSIRVVETSTCTVIGTCTVTTAPVCRRQKKKKSRNTREICTNLVAK